MGECEEAGSSGALWARDRCRQCRGAAAGVYIIRTAEASSGVGGARAEAMIRAVTPFFIVRAILMLRPPGLLTAGTVTCAAVPPGASARGGTWRRRGSCVRRGGTIFRTIWGTSEKPHYLSRCARLVRAPEIRSRNSFRNALGHARREAASALGPGTTQSDSPCRSIDTQSRTSQMQLRPLKSKSAAARQGSRSVYCVQVQLLSAHFHEKAGVSTRHDPCSRHI